jgi:HPt (histidine-containing phosphotransfer) domain-containing protein
MPNEAIWPVPTPRALSRLCAGLDGGGGGGRDPVWDHTALLRTFRGNTSAVVRVTRVFLDDCPRSAQRLRVALRAGDRVTLQRLAHRIKGNAGILRAGTVREAAERLERHVDRGDLEDAEPQLRALEQCLARLCDSLSEFLARTESTSLP